jgi:hypothetical protein
MFTFFTSYLHTNVYTNILSDTETFIVLVSHFGTKEFSVSNLGKANSLSLFIFSSQERGQCLI